jgi:hypothetical protein
MFRFAAAIARVRVVPQNIGIVFFDAAIILGGFVLSRSKCKSTADFFILLTKEESIGGIEYDRKA